MLFRRAVAAVAKEETVKDKIAHQPEFTSEHGLRARREDNGDVTLWIAAASPGHDCADAAVATWEHRFPAASWASLVSHVTADGPTTSGWNLALARQVGPEEDAEMKRKPKDAQSLSLCGTHRRTTHYHCAACEVLRLKCELKNLTEAVFRAADTFAISDGTTALGLLDEVGKTLRYHSQIKSFDTPPVGEVRECFMCSKPRPWGLFSSKTGAAMCSPCRDSRFDLEVLSQAVALERHARCGGHLIVSTEGGAYHDQKCPMCAAEAHLGSVLAGIQRRVFGAKT